jgi:hypothetical protein
VAKQLKLLILAFFSNLLTKWLEDFFIMSGVAVLIGTTYMKYGITAGNYLLGAVLLIIGFLLAKK